MDLTDEQKQIIAISQTMQDNEILAIQACAGSGKTSTLREIALANPNAKFLYLAFNKAIVVESKSKFPKNVEVKTIHSIAFAFTKEKLGTFRPTSKLNRFDLEDIIEFEDKKDAFAVLKIFDLFLKSDKTLQDSLKDKAIIEFLYESTLKRKLPITHNFYLKFYQLSDDKHLDYDFILLDEAQDMNQTMIRVFLDNDCKKILVGDSFQNIYGFNDSINAFEIVKANHYATLSKSFRCKQQILDYANLLLSTFSTKTFTKMTSGFVKSIESNQNPKSKAFITRTNAGIIKLIHTLENVDDFCLLKEPNKIFAPLWAIIHFKNAKFEFIPKEYAYLKKIKSNKEFYAYILNSNDLELQNAFKLLNYDMDLVEITKKANKLFYNKNATNFILNAHQSKGLEWDSVELIDDFPNLYDNSLKLSTIDNFDEKQKKSKEFEQELNLFYVAITRAKKKLIDNTSNLSLFAPQLKDNTITFGNLHTKVPKEIMTKTKQEKLQNDFELQIHKEKMIHKRYYR